MVRYKDYCEVPLIIKLAVPKLTNKRHGSTDKTSVTSKRKLLTQLQDGRKVNIAELLKKKLRKDIGFFSSDMEKYLIYSFNLNLQICEYYYNQRSQQIP